MTIQIGETLPEVTLHTMTDHGPEPIGPAFFRGRTVALFAVPGAFTPTCSAKHLPGYLDKADELHAKGVDAIACLAVNDVFVLSAWAKANQVDGRITLLADGNGEFTRAVGLEMDGTTYGMGLRSQRYAMLVVDGVVRQLHVEQPGEFRVSSADHLLESIEGAAA